MDPAFTLLGRGKLGRSLHQAWGGRIPLLASSTRPEGWVFLAVPDKDIPRLAQAFAGRCVHGSGSLHLEDVPCAHPLMSFRGEAEDWRGTPLAITGIVPVFITQAFQEAGFEPFLLPAELKALYHACAVLTSGHAATLWLGALQLLEAHGIHLPGRGLWPLAEATLRNVSHLGYAGRTGPFVRQDHATIERDLAALPHPWRQIFLELGSAPLT